MKLLSLIEKILGGIEAGIVVVLLGSMVVLAFLQVILRNVFSFGFLWADPLLRYMVVWVGFLGAAIATKEEKHLGIDLLNRFMGPRTLQAVKIIVEGFAMVVAYLLTRAAFQFLFEGIAVEEKDLFDLPKRLFFAIIPVGFGLITLHFFIRLIAHFHRLFSGQKMPERQPSNPLP